MECESGGLYFSSNFDTGNLGRVEEVSKETEVPLSSVSNVNKRHNIAGKSNITANGNQCGNVGIYELKVDYDFKVWTMPDCAGTQFENGNRTWFHFFVRGYTPGKIMRITIMNMNKQARIYSQGYSPLYRVCRSTLSQSRWQRIRDRPAWEIVDGQFNLTFVHRFIDPRGSSTYFAFSFPWSYTETQRQLDQLEAIFRHQVFSAPTEVKPNLAVSADAKKADLGRAVSGPIEDGLTSADLFQQIYFHRELLCYSLDGRRIDLLTITDWSGRKEQREDYFDPLLFPNRSFPRPWKFEGKKVVFISSRVHPGETPSSHVFNGLLELLLRPTDSRACQLRKQYVFKLIPLLNPDGVVRGHYRSDSRGVNLNRVYLEPDFLYYPSVYATKALMVYHHTHYADDQQYAAFLHPLWEEFKQLIRTPSERMKPPLVVNRFKGANVDLNGGESAPSLPSTEDQVLTGSDLVAVDKEPIPPEKVSSQQTSDEVIPPCSDPPVVSSPVVPTTSSITDSLNPGRNLVITNHKLPPVILNVSKEDYSSEGSIQAVSSSQVSTTFNIDDGTNGGITEVIENSIQETLAASEHLLNGPEKTSAITNDSSEESVTRHADKVRSSVTSVSNRLSAISKSCKSSRLLAAFRGRHQPSIHSLFTKWNATPQQTLIKDKIEEADTDAHSVSMKGNPDGTWEAISKQPSFEETDSMEPNSVTISIPGKQHPNHLGCKEVETSLKDTSHFRCAKQMKMRHKFGRRSFSSTSSSKKPCSEDAMPRPIHQDSKCLCTLVFEPGNEGSDEEEDIHQSQAPHPEETEDFSINPQYLDIIDHVTTFVRAKSRTTQTVDQFGPLTVDAALGQLNQLRRALHMSEASLRQLKGNSGLAFYIDLHGHCSKRGCFLYGNWLESEEEMTDNVLFALLVAVNSSNFDFNACNFTARNMYQRDRRGTSTKEGSGRVATWKHLGLVHSYTLECNYNTGPLVNRLWRCLSKAPPDDGGRLTPPGTFFGPYWTDIVDSVGIQTLCSPTLFTTGLNSNTDAPVSVMQPQFTPAHYEEVGRALLYAVLDMNQTNPWPRLATLGGEHAVPGVGGVPILTGFAEFSSMKALRDWVRKYVRGLTMSGAGGFGLQHPKPSILRPCQHSAPQESLGRGENLTRVARINRQCQMKSSATELASEHTGDDLAQGEPNLPGHTRTGFVPAQSRLNPIHLPRNNQIQPKSNSCPGVSSSEHVSLLPGQKNHLSSKHLDTETSLENSFMAPVSFEDQEKPKSSKQINNAGLQKPSKTSSHNKVILKRTTSIRGNAGIHCQNGTKISQRTSRQSDYSIVSRPGLSKEIYIKTSMLRTRDPARRKDGKRSTRQNKSPNRTSLVVICDVGNRALDTSAGKCHVETDLPNTPTSPVDRVKIKKSQLKDSSIPQNEADQPVVEESVLAQRLLVLSDEKRKAAKAFQLENIQSSDKHKTRSNEDKFRSSRSLKILKKIFTTPGIESSGDFAEVLTARSLFSLPDLVSDSAELRSCKSKRHARDKSDANLINKHSNSTLHPDAPIWQKRPKTCQLIKKGIRHLRNKVDFNNNNSPYFGRWSTVRSTDVGDHHSARHSRTPERITSLSITQSLEELCPSGFPCTHRYLPPIAPECTHRLPCLGKQGSKTDRLLPRNAFNLEGELRTASLTSSMFFAHRSENGKYS
ncbi:hypothetical protein CRM22_002629 [Opisthorchis felineus]|uniref:Peptidase M14 domain-containing protein n=1 Tax=Opisthorchis felineus TaxID=147828 RepID=A0A4S2MBC6_OPIFE|nr:hypothetical protein CRM22_002629 [Opisthorchis felineus]